MLAYHVQTFCSRGQSDSSRETIIDTWGYDDVVWICEELAETSWACCCHLLLYLLLFDLLFCLLVMLFQW
jgi:hypothetical protein